MKPLTPSKTGGFTLVEILIAVFIFAVVLSTIFTTYSASFRIVDQTETQADIYAMARTALERMTEDLESVCVIATENTQKTGADTQRPDLFVGEEKEIDDRHFDTLRFLSSAHIGLNGPGPESGATRIAYYASESSREKGATLFRSDTPELSQEPAQGTGGLPLCEGLSSVNFTYYGGDGQAHEIWDSTRAGTGERLPTMVVISLEFVNRRDPESPIRFSTGVSLPVAREIYESASKR